MWWVSIVWWLFLSETCLAGCSKPLQIQSGQLYFFVIVKVCKSAFHCCSMQPTVPPRQCFRLTGRGIKRTNASKPKMASQYITLKKQSHFVVAFFTMKTYNRETACCFLLSFSFRFVLSSSLDQKTWAMFLCTCKLVSLVLYVMLCFLKSWRFLSLSSHSLLTVRASGWTRDEWEWERGEKKPHN